MKRFIWLFCGTVIAFLMWCSLLWKGPGKEIMIVHYGFLLLGIFAAELQHRYKIPWLFFFTPILALFLWTYVFGGCAEGAVGGVP